MESAKRKVKESARRDACTVWILSDVRLLMAADAGKVVLPFTHRSWLSQNPLVGHPGLSLETKNRYSFEKQ